MTESGQNTMPDTKVGMFWCVERTVVGEAVPLSEAEPYGDALQHGGHYDFWLHLEPRIEVERRLKCHASARPGGLFSDPAAVPALRGWLFACRGSEGDNRFFRPCRNSSRDRERHALSMRWV